MISLQIKRLDIEISSDTTSQIERAFGCALDRFQHVIREVEVTLLDVNGPKGGVDKRCRVQVRLYPRGLIAVKSTGICLLEAANNACDKTRQAIAKRLDKQRTRPQGGLKAMADGAAYEN